MSPAILPSTAKPFIYLAIPYSHPLLVMRRLRFEIVNRTAAELIRKGNMVYSPISHSHPIAEAGCLETNWEYWRLHDEAIMTLCHKLVVVCVEGWELSHGVKQEIELAKKHDLPIEFLDPVL